MSSKTAVDFEGYPVSIYSMPAASGHHRWYTRIAPGRILFDFIWVWTMSHLQNSWLIPVAGGHKKGKDLYSVNTRWIWTQGSCPWNCFLQQNLCAYMVILKVGPDVDVNDHHFSIYIAYLECLLVGQQIFVRYHLYLFRHYWALRFSDTFFSTPSVLNVWRLYVTKNTVLQSADCISMYAIIPTDF